MRNVFFDRFKKIIREDDSIFFLTGDTGYNLVETVLTEVPERAINVGVAEQNMIGIASGLAHVGFIPVCYAITNFLIERCFEQIRNDICLHGYKAILVGTSTGFDNGALGATHHKLDDIGAVKALPNLRIYSPSGIKSMSIILEEALEAEHASFIRISKGNYEEDGEISDPNHYIYKNASPVLVISHGKMITNSIAAFNEAPEFSLFAMDRIKPLDDKVLKNLMLKYQYIFVIEDNFNSGLFNSICQWSVENQCIPKGLFSISPDEGYDEFLGDSNFLEDKHGLSPQKIAEQISTFQSKL